LVGGGERLVFAAWDDRAPRLLSWGADCGAFCEDDARLAQPPVPQGQLDDGEAFDIFPTAGAGFAGAPAISGHCDGRPLIAQLRLEQVTEAPGGLVFRLADPAAGLEVEVSYGLDAATGVLTTGVSVTNTGREILTLESCSAAVLPLPWDELMVFDGRWARELRPVRARLQTGMIVKENRTGRTSHHAPPFLAAGSAGFCETAGDVLGVHLAWSGDHRLLAERLRDGRMQLAAGEAFGPGEVRLAPGSTYDSPRLYAARSAHGLNGLSDRLHPFVRDVILAGRLSGRARPVHFNTWEAVYFDQSLDGMRALADVAAKVGAERFVLDDGWFKGRDSDRSSLGDWTVDARKYPRGLGPLIDHVRGLGMEFGLWVEPEMVNRDSDLFRAHPDWILGDPGRAQPLGRGQLVLDLSRPEAADAVFDQLHGLLSTNAIAYLKWDMNRDLTQPLSGGRWSVGAQTRSVYALIDRLRVAHPQVEIESCASGGGRADYEILRRTDRIWTSDCNDPVERQTIQRAFSIFFPPEVMGAHVGPRRSHTTARSASLEMRALTALFGHMGIEGDLRAFEARELEALAGWIALHKRMRPLLHGGRVLRLEHPDPGLAAFVVVDGGALVSVAQLETSVHALAAPLRLSGLDVRASYRLTLLNPTRHPERSMKQAPAYQHEPLTVSGAHLMHAGLTLPVLGAGELALFQLELIPCV
jgi:alpha-galactosidase